MVHLIQNQIGSVTMPIRLYYSQHADENERLVRKVFALETIRHFIENRYSRACLRGFELVRESFWVNCRLLNIDVNLVCIMFYCTHPGLL